ncbi:MAG: single-stranded-DNA-specific exonuclease RecJ, partial [Pseudomonadota bacterium]
MSVSLPEPKPTPEPEADAEPATDNAVAGVSRSATGRLWVRRLGPGEERTALALAQRHNLPEVAARVLAARGVSV